MMPENEGPIPRRSWLKLKDRWTPISIAWAVIVLAVGLVVADKLYRSDLSLSLVNLTTTDFLSLVLAFFSIWLSMMFYWKADESSQRFYDDTYKFTRDVSTMLGRIESGFGSHLQHLNENYGRLDNRMDRLTKTEKEAEDVVETKVEDVRSAQESTEKLFEDLAQKAKLDEREKAELEARLKETQAMLLHNSQELERARNALTVAQLERGLLSEDDGLRGPDNPSRQDVHRRLRDLRSFEQEIRNHARHSPELTASLEQAVSTGHLSPKAVPAQIWDRLRRHKLMTSNGALSSVGVELIKMALVPF